MSCDNCGKAVDGLFDKIEKIIYDSMDYIGPKSFSSHLAHTIIKELGLRRVTGQGPYSNQYWYITDMKIEQ